MGNNVNHPDHYNAGGYECIEVMEANFGKDKVQDFCLLNAFKYLWRADKKSGLEDIKKANWYLNRYLALENSEKHYIMETQHYNDGKSGYLTIENDVMECSVCGSRFYGIHFSDCSVWHFCPACGTSVRVMCRWRKPTRGEN